MKRVIRWATVALLFFARLGSAQTAAQPASTPVPSAPQLSPQAAYDEALRPVEIVRRAVENWSEVEQAALAVAVSNAKVACAAHNPSQFTSEDLLADARLCAFAQMWEPVQQAATGYLVAQSAATPDQKRSGFPNLSMAFDYVVQASLHLKNTVHAFGTAQTMLRYVAYDDLVAEAVNSVVRYVQLIQTDQALTLLEQRQPQLLAILRSRRASPDPDKNGNTTRPASDSLLPSSRPPMAVHDIYADAIQLPTMQQFAGQPERAASSLAELEAALPQALSADDAILIAAFRRQYKLLGAPLPDIAALASLVSSASKQAPDLNRKHAGAAAFLLFPYWCAQCVAMNPHFNEASAALKAQGVQFYALLAEGNPLSTVSRPAAKGAANTPPNTARSNRSARPSTANLDIEAGAPSSAADQLMGTSTLIVPVALLDTFAATDFPLLIATDGCGVVRYIGVASDNVLVRGGLVYQVADRIKQQWPVATQRTATDGSAHDERSCGVGVERHAGK